MTQIKTPLANAAISNDAQILQDIHLKTKNIAVYQREIEPLKEMIAQVVERSIIYRASGTAAEITNSLNIYFANELPDYNLLLEDILGLLGVFEQVTEIDSFRLLLATVNTNMCRRFHTDINDVRMLCTYVGPGTLWAPDEAINHKAYQKGSGNEEIILDESLIQQVDTGDVVILKGALYPDATPILHRSPSIEEHGGKRLLLRIDTNASQNLWS